MVDVRAVAAAGVSRGVDTRALALGGLGPARFAVADPIDRRVAVQGAGFSTRVLALQGFDPYMRRITPASRVKPVRRAPRRRDSDDDVLLFILR